jgi:hypothetical protein
LRETKCTVELTLVTAMFKIIVQKPKQASKDQPVCIRWNIPVKSKHANGI